MTYKTKDGSKVETFIRKHPTLGGYVGCIRVRTPLAMPYSFDANGVVRLTRLDALEDARIEIEQLGWDNA